MRDGTWGYFEDFRGLLDRQPSEKSQFDDARTPRVDFGQPGQRVVEGADVRRPLVASRSDGIETVRVIHQDEIATTFERGALPRRIDSGRPLDGLRLERNGPRRGVRAALSRTRIANIDLDAGWNAARVVAGRTRDQRVPVANAFGLYQGLQDRGVMTRMVVYRGFDGLGHVPTRPKSSRALMEHNLEWFDKYVFEPTRDSTSR